MINDVARKVGKNIAGKIDYNQDQTAVLIYSLIRLINNTIWLGCLFILASMLNVTKEVAIFIAIFMPLRSRFGGWHVKKDYVCLAISVFVPLVAAYIAKNIYFNVYHLIAIYLASFTIAIRTGVVDNPNKRLKPEKKKKFQKQGIYILIFITIIHLLLYRLDYIVESNVIAIAVFLAFINLLFGE